MLEVIANTKEVILLQYINVSSQYVLYFKLLRYYMPIISQSQNKDKDYLLFSNKYRVKFYSFLFENFLPEEIKKELLSNSDLMLATLECSRYSLVRYQIR